MCGHKTEQAEVPAVQWLPGRDFTFPPPRFRGMLGTGPRAPKNGAAESGA